MARARRYAKYLVSLFCIFVLAAGTLLWWQGGKDGPCRVSYLSSGEDINGSIEVGREHFKIGELVPITLRLTFNNGVVPAKEENLRRVRFAPFELSQDGSFKTCREGSKTEIVFMVNGQILSHLPAEFLVEPLEIVYTLKSNDEAQSLYVSWPPEFSMKSAITENTFMELTPEKSQEGFLGVIVGTAIAISIMSFWLQRFVGAILLRKKASSMSAQGAFDLLFPKWHTISDLREKLQYAYIVVYNRHSFGHDDERERLMKLCSASFAKDFSGKTVQLSMGEIESQLTEWSKKAVSQKKGGGLP